VAEPFESWCSWFLKTFEDVKARTRDEPARLEWIAKEDAQTAEAATLLNQLVAYFNRTYTATSYLARAPADVRPALDDFRKRWAATVQAVGFNYMWDTWPLKNVGPEFLKEGLEGGEPNQHSITDSLNEAANLLFNTVKEFHFEDNPEMQDRVDEAIGAVDYAIAAPRGGWPGIVRRTGMLAEILPVLVPKEVADSYKRGD
jgi:hypothetical protein